MSVHCWSCHQEYYTSWLRHVRPTFSAPNFNSSIWFPHVEYRLLGSSILCGFFFIWHRLVLELWSLEMLICELLEYKWISVSSCSLGIENGNPTFCSRVVCSLNRISFFWFFLYNMHRWTINQQGGAFWDRFDSLCNCFVTAISVFLLLLLLLFGVRCC